MQNSGWSAELREAALLPRGHGADALLGEQKDAIPIADSLDALASVFRANAYKIVGDQVAAAQTLRELPNLQLLDLVRGSFPALKLCVQSGEAYGEAVTQEAAMNRMSPKTKARA